MRLRARCGCARLNGLDGWVERRWMVLWCSLGSNVACFGVEQKGPASRISLANLFATGNVVGRASCCDASVVQVAVNVVQLPPVWSRRARTNHTVCRCCKCTAEVGVGIGGGCCGGGCTTRQTGSVPGKHLLKQLACFAPTCAPGSCRTPHTQVGGERDSGRAIWDQRWINPAHAKGEIDWQRVRQRERGNRTRSAKHTNKDSAHKVVDHRSPSSDLLVCVIYVV
jgi:hypothetical protein